LSIDPCNNTKWHQTSRENWESIKKTGKMLRGPSGLAGPGIYFAETDTDHKALNKGIIVLPVCLGKIKTIDKEGNSGVTYRDLIHAVIAKMVMILLNSSIR